MNIENNIDESKRDFIKNAIVGTAAVTVLNQLTFPSLTQAETAAPKLNIEFVPLPYADDALEPFISKRTLNNHYNEHHRFAFDQVKSRITGTELENSTMEQIILKTRDTINMSKTLNLMAILCWNHSFYWRSMKPSGSQISSSFNDVINTNFGNNINFKKEFFEKAMQPGSGWVWLVYEGGKLKVRFTEYHDTPLLDNQIPLLTLDCWEHAYYLDYQNKKGDYIQAFYNKIADWSFAEANYKAAQKSLPNSK